MYNYVHVSLVKYIALIETIELGVKYKTSRLSMPLWKFFI